MDALVNVWLLALMCWVMALTGAWVVWHTRRERDWFGALLGGSTAMMSLPAALALTSIGLGL